VAIGLHHAGTEPGIWETTRGRRANNLYRVAVASVIVAAFSGVAAAAGTVVALRASAPQRVKVERMAPPAASTPGPK